MKKQLNGYRLHLVLLCCFALVLGAASVSFAGSHAEQTPPITVTLKDANNQPIIPDPVTGIAPAYSTKETCGGCHNYANIEQHSYHAQLGANEQKGWMAYNPNSPDGYKAGPATKGKSWVQSPGHAGKW